MKKGIIYYLRTDLSILFLLVLIFSGCKKTDTLVEVPSQAHFVTSAQYLNYYVTSAATDSFVVQVGTTDVSSSDRTISFNISSPTGAVKGTHYTITSPSSGNAITIPAGQTVGSIKIHGIFSAYAGTRKDTLIFTLSQPSVEVAKFSDTVRVALQKYCPVNAPSFVGNYTRSFDIDPTGTYGPYTSTIVSVTPLTATTASMIIANFSFAEISPYPISNITVNLDWTDPGNFKTTIPSQILSNSDFYGYGPLTVKALGNGTFSSCDNTFTFNYELTVAAGSFGGFTTVMAR